MAPLYGAMAPQFSGKGPKHSDKKQEFHQEMLRKLALHLAAQPDAQPEPQEPEAMRDESPENVSHFCECAPFFKQVEPSEESVGQHSDGRPDTPSFCATPEEHGMPVWTDRNASSFSYEEGEGYHCVCVPSYIVHGLLETLEGKGRKERKDQNFHQEMLRKLALHLAAQPKAPEAQAYPAACPPQVQVVEKAEVPKAPRIGGRDEEFHKQMLQKLALHLAAQPDVPKEPEAPRPRAAPASSTGPMHAAPVSGNHAAPEHQELLRKLALHLAAQPEPLEKPRQLEIEPSAAQLGEDKAHCDRLMVDLEAEPKRSEVMSWVLCNVQALALTQFGSRVVQKAIAGACVAERERFAGLLHFATELYVSPHGNHVLAKLIEVLPSSRLVCIAEAMRSQAPTVARHQFGSRILERLMEHCSEEQIGFLLDELMDDLEALARHPFANFVVQHIFEHGLEDRKALCFRRLLPHVLQHATHKTASNVVQRMLEHADVSSQALIADAFLAGEGDFSLETIAATRYGSFVIHSLVDKLHPRIDAIKSRVKAAHPQLQQSKFSQKNILDFLGEAFFSD
ncbi:unnamed protein product [Effrenium voratum]|uniref:PUM-HD domain-containing protein n=1 Tax=Effrenium voratum TaxID=2562239 RepID=A0AA36IMI7_9DINO|nr:unnamed protein product [Effrenium voratum]